MQAIRPCRLGSGGIRGLLSAVFTLLTAFTTGWSLSALAAETSIEEIIVTATKREESIQEIPIAVSAFSGQDLDQRGVVDMYGLQEVAPSVAVYNSNSTSNGGTFRIRGIGTTGNNPGLESAVGTFIDGIYRSRSGIAFNDMVDIERVEILRGPQGTLFGKNTSAGAINVISARPSFDETTGYAEVSAGNLDTVKLKGAVGGPMSESWAYRIAGSWHSRDEGPYKDFETGEYYDTRDRWMLKGALEWQATDNFNALLIADYGEKREDCCPAAYNILGATAPIMAAINPDTFLTEDPSSRLVGVNYEPFENSEDGGFVLDLTWDVSDSTTIKSITGYRDFSVLRSQDWDFGNFDLAGEPGQDIDESFENWSQEFQFVGSAGSVDWLVGLYIYSEELKTDEQLIFGSDADAYWNIVLPAFLEIGYDLGDWPEGEGYEAAWETKTDGWAIFTHNVWNISEQFNLTLGLRYTEEEKDGTGIVNGMSPLDSNATGAELLAATTAANDPLCGRNDEARGSAFGAAFCDNASWERKRKDDALTGTLALGWTPADGQNLYASYSRGFKAGGLNHDQQGLDVSGVFVDPVNGVPADGIEWEDENVDAFEIGHKGQFLDDRLSVNSAIFHTNIKDFQLNTFTGTGFVVGNPGDAKSTGVEVEGNWLAHEYVTVVGGVTYADAKYKDNVPNLGGQNLTYAPKWTTSIATYIDVPVGNNWSAFGNVNWAWRDKHNSGSDLDPEKVVDSYSLWNGQLGVRTLDQRWEAFLWCRNCFDEDYNVVIFDSVLQPTSFSTFLASQRQWGGTIRTNF
jgi:outer membrane receptor protein involved in Fe transport